MRIKTVMSYKYALLAAILACAIGERGRVRSAWHMTDDDWIPITSSTPGLNPVYQPDGEQSQSESSESIATEPVPVSGRERKSEEETVTTEAAVDADGKSESLGRTRWSNRLIPVDIPYYAHLKNNQQTPSSPASPSSTPPSAIVEMSPPSVLQQHNINNGQPSVQQPINRSPHQLPQIDSIIESHLLTVQDGPLGSKGRLMAKSLLGTDNQKVKLLVRRPAFLGDSIEGPLPLLPPFKMPAPNANKMKHLLGDFGLAKSFSKWMSRSWALPSVGGGIAQSQLGPLEEFMIESAGLPPKKFPKGAGIKKASLASHPLLRHGLHPIKFSSIVSGTIGGPSVGSGHVTGNGGSSSSIPISGGSGFPLPLTQLARLINEHQLMGIEPNGQVRLFSAKSLASRRSSELENTQFFLLLPNLAQDLRAKAIRAAKKKSKKTKKSIKNSLFGSKSAVGSAPSPTLPLPPPELGPITEPASDHVAAASQTLSRFLPNQMVYPDLPFPMPR